MEVKMEEANDPNMSSTLHGYINFKIKGLDGKDLFFSIKRSTKLQCVVNAYCGFYMMDINSITFIFNGRRLQMAKTPDELDMKDGDEIFILLGSFCSNDCGRWKASIFEKEESKQIPIEVEEKHVRTKKKTLDLKETNDKSGYVILNIKSLTGGMQSFKMKRSTKMEQLMDAYSDYSKFGRDNIRFLFAGRQLSGEQTPDELHMQDGSIITYVHRLRGC